EKKRRKDNMRMSLKMNIVLLGMICIGLVVCSSAREIEKNGKSDGDLLICSNDEGHCPDNNACNKFCLSVPYPGGGYCIKNNCCCKA
ncbi:hypothetical protein VIGAN_07239300, partial [Vigna angularis var. angularis]